MIVLTKILSSLKTKNGKWKITIIELSSAIGIVIKPPHGKPYYIPPVISCEVKINLPKYVVEEFPFLKEFPEVET